MNVERMLKLADEIENPSLPVGFNMQYFCQINGRFAFETKLKDIPIGCGTVTCMGGAAIIMFGSPQSKINQTHARRLLSLSREQADKLFFNYYNYVSRDNAFGEITREEAAAAIRRMVAEEA